ncbi:MAG: flippase-like domain-containing protein [Bacteroidales bacterium]|nr:flippase-like domain-containing protein [Bacteroidales bacterium]
MEANLKKTLRYIVSLALAGLLLFASFHGVEWADFVAGLKECRWWFLLLSMLAGAAAFMLRGLRWRNLLSPLSEGGIGRLDAYDAVTIGNVSNMVFPFLGEFVRCGLVSKKQKIRYDKVLGTVALERVWDMLSVAILFVILFVFTWVKFGAFFTERIWLPLTSRFTWVVWLILAIVSVTGCAVLYAIVSSRGSNSLLNRIHDAFSGLFQGFGSVLRMEKKWAFMLQTALIWAMYWLQIVFLTHALPAAEGMGIVDALFIMLAGSIASFVPVPGGFGAYHYLVALSLSSLYGFSWQMGIVFATIAHESQALTMIITGAASFLRQSIRR